MGECYTLPKMGPYLLYNTSAEWVPPLCAPEPVATNGAYLDINDATESYVSFEPFADINSLQTRDFTVELWVRPSIFTDRKGVNLIGKQNGWRTGWAIKLFYYAPSVYIWFEQFKDGGGYPGSGVNLTVTASSFWDSWYHFAGCFKSNPTGGDTVSLYLDGVGTTLTGDDPVVYPDDAAWPLKIGSTGVGGTGSGQVLITDADFGWVRISDGIRYAANFTPPDRLIVPAMDEDTLFLTGLVDWTTNPVACTQSGEVDGSITGDAAIARVLPLEDAALNLSAYWPFDADYNDASGNGNHLSAPGDSPGLGTGVWGQALDLDAAEYLKIDTNSLLQTGDVTWTMCGLVRIDGLSGNDQEPIASMIDPSTGNREWSLIYDSANGGVAIQIFDGTTNQVATAKTSGALTQGTWYWMAWGYDADEDQAFVYVDSSYVTGNADGTPGTVAAADLQFGTILGWESWYGNVSLDEVYFIKGYKPTPAEIEDMYNDGDGRSWFGFKNLFYGMSKLELVPFQMVRMEGTATAPDTTWPQYWLQSYDLYDDITFQAGSFYPITTGSNFSGFVFRSQEELGADQWVSFRIAEDGAWTATDFIGVFVRQSLSAATFYGVLVDAGGMKLIKMIAGSESVLDASIGWVPTQGDLIVLKAQGTTISVDLNGVNLLQVTDSSIASGHAGILAQGSEADNAASDFKIGNLPVGNLAVSVTGWITNADNNSDEIAITSDCGGAFDADIVFDYNLTNVDTCSTDHTHFVEIDFGEIRLIDGFRTWVDSTSGSFQYDNLAIKAKIDADDAWSTMFSGEDISQASPTANTWSPSDEGIRFTPFACRYVRVEIASTEEANNALSITEWEFHG